MKADPQARIKLCICHATKLPTPSHKRRWLLGSVVDEYIPHSKLGNRHQPRTRRAVLWCVVLRPIGKKGQLLNQVYEKGDDILGLTPKISVCDKIRLPVDFNLEAATLVNLAPHERGGFGPCASNLARIILSMVT